MTEKIKEKKKVNGIGEWKREGKSEWDEREIEKIEKES